MKSSLECLVKALSRINNDEIAANDRVVANGGAGLLSPAKYARLCYIDEHALKTALIDRDFVSLRARFDDNVVRNGQPPGPIFFDFIHNFATNEAHLVGSIQNRLNLNAGTARWTRLAQLNNWIYPAIANARIQDSLLEEPVQELKQFGAGFRYFAGVDEYALRNVNNANVVAEEVPNYDGLQILNVNEALFRALNADVENLPENLPENIQMDALAIPDNEIIPMDADAINDVLNPVDGYEDVNNEDFDENFFNDLNNANLLDDDEDAEGAYDEEDEDESGDEDEYDEGEYDEEDEDEYEEEQPLPQPQPQEPQQPLLNINQPNNNDPLFPFSPSQLAMRGLNRTNVNPTYPNLYYPDDDEDEGVDV